MGRLVTARASKGASGRMYSVGTSESGSIKYGAQINVPADTVVVVHSVVFGDADGTYAGDANEFMIRVQIAYLEPTVTDGSGGTLTPVALSQGSAASGVTFRRGGVTAPTTTGGSAAVWTALWNARGTLVYRPPPMLRPTVSPGDSFVLRYPDIGVSDSFRNNVSITWEERGG